MKKHLINILTIISFLLSTLLISSACTSEIHNDNNKLKIVTTIFPQYDFARAVAGNYADITMLLSPGAETHSFDPTPKDIKKIQNCDIFIYTGGESDSWIDNILESIDTEKTTIISLMDIVSLLDEEHKEGMLHSHEDEEEKEYDEHVWTSPVNAILITEKIRDTVIKKDPQNKDAYISNAGKYISKLKTLDEDFRTIVANAQRKLFIFADRFPLLYFAKEYGLDYYAAYPGCSSGTEFSPATIAFLIDKVKSENIPVIFKIELSSGNVAQTISDETSAKILTFYSCHNISRKDFENGETYVSLMKKNINSLKEALN